MSVTSIRNIYWRNKDTNGHIPHLEAVVSPGTEFHDAALLIKWEILDINLAGGFVDRWRLPEHFSREL
jgi:hypothetical protein